MQDFQTRTGIMCEITSCPESTGLAEHRTTAVFRVFQDALTNVALHANATMVQVSLEERTGELTLKVRDNGRGITESEMSDAQSLGLIETKERALTFGGEVDIYGVEGEGTTLAVRIPLCEEQ